MKKFLLAILMCVSSAVVFAQDNSQPVVAVSNTRMNIIYTGVNNSLDIAVAGVADNDLVVSINNGTMEKEAPGRFSVLVMSPGRTVIELFVRENGNLTKIGEKEFRVKLVPDPEVVIGKEVSGATFKKAVLAAQLGVRAVLDNFDYDVKFQVESFTLCATIDGKEECISAEGSAFKSEQKLLINRLKSGDKVIIKDVKVKGPDNKVRDLKPAIFTIE